MKSNDKKSVFSLLPVILLLSLVVPASVQATGPRVTTQLFTPGMEIYALDFPPFISTQVDGGGLDAEIIEAVLKAVDMEGVVTAIPLPGMLEYYLAQENAIAVLGRGLKLSAKQKKNLVSIPVSVSSEKYFYYKPSHETALSWQGKLKNLKAYTYGAHKGEDVKVYRDAGIAVEFGGSRSLLKKLRSGKVDFIKLPALSAEWMIEKYHPEQKTNFVEMKTPVGEKPTYIMFNKKHADGKESAKKFSKGLSEIINNGVYQALVEKHLGIGERTDSYMRSWKRFSGR